MRKGIHPDYGFATVSCACGATFRTRSTRAEYRLEICSNCHPFFTGQQKFVDTAGRVEKFRQRYQKKASSEE
ncbi:MAG: 50S ribosomal protein L31 [Candidatus Hydrogenedentota bacterium]|jgi:large subunit ribosomal protein L31|uniref:Large ribosomal subunit protein bL31 n=1 Tax=Sumerlaea chitinivorans TaxID=2250252 RepID=A0A2Z4Y1S6_SUMC1|nr:ribosomal protein L31 [Candidatus Sumerlaea chitinivorans]MCX7963285.1 50S ribosomal protein L31 [Candidatus Sumerlaea chitinivorans]RMH29269.1 MAG: 50S ribosomal protein L31 [Candidatus Hydrogenedentota bacterium]GIX44765.1 MAG: 50S ribosomal protein L31 [Candidatus Sumerlaea sp.]